MRWLGTIGLLSLMLLPGCGIFQRSPEPCDCGQADKEMRAYMLQYFEALEDKGNLRQQLKACEERR